MRIEIRKNGSHKLVYKFDSLQSALEAYRAEITERGWAVNRDNLIALLSEDAKYMYHPSWDDA